MKSKTLIDKQAKRKYNPDLVETILKAKKHEKWQRVAGLLSLPRKLKIEKNLDEIDKESKEADTIIVPGKVLGNGEISKRIRIAAVSFSKESIRKLKEKKCEIVSLKKEIEINPEARGVKILN